MNIKNHVIGYSKMLQPWKEGLDWVLLHGESKMESCPQKGFESWYTNNKPMFFQKIRVFEKCALSPSFGLSFFIYPNTIKVFYGIEKIDSPENFYVPAFWVDSFMKEGKTHQEAEDLTLEKIILQWQENLSRSLETRIRPLFFEDEKDREVFLQKINLLKGTGELEKLQDMCFRLSFALDAIQEGKLS